MVAGLTKVFCGAENGVCELTKDTVYTHPTDKQCSWVPTSTSPFTLLTTGSSSTSFVYDFMTSSYNIYYMTFYVSARGNYNADTVASYHVITVRMGTSGVTSSSTIDKFPEAFRIPLYVKKNQSSYSTNAISVYAYKSIDNLGTTYLWFQCPLDPYTIETGGTYNMHSIHATYTGFYLDSYGLTDISCTYSIYGVS